MTTNTLISPRIGILTTSHPRFPEDEAGIFVGRLIDALSEVVSGVVITPADKHDCDSAIKQSFTIKRYRYGLFTPGRLAFGSGIIPNIKSSPLLIFQVPGLMLVMFITAWRCRAQVDLFHCNWVITGLIGWLLNLCTGKPFIVSLRGRDAKLVTIPLLGAVFRCMLKRAAAVTSVNQSFLETLTPLTNFTPEKLVYIPNGVNVPDITRPEAEAIYAKYNLPLDQPCLLFVGTLIKRKQVDRLVTLLSNRSLKDFHLILAGRTTDVEYVQAIKHKIAEFELNDRIHITGPVPPGDIPGLLKLAFAYVTASALEGRPNSVLEALCAGVPVIASNIAAHAEIITPEKNGYLFNPDSPELAVAALLKLQADTELREAISAAARSDSAQRSWQVCAEDYLRLFRRVASGTSAA